ncbi:MAG: ABC transporter permease [Phycisphaerales bacterium]|nr:ABC transporter permease [Phycisphaerales bacterium]
MKLLAILHDQYRALAAGKIFWVVLVLSGLVVAAFGAVGINKTGLTVLWWEFDAIFNTSLLTPATFYKLVFVNVGIKFWLAWIASILALISTASIIPEFISSGAIELTLSKPISRVKLYFTKFLAGLLFVTLQVGVFTTAAFLVIGVRGGTWEPGLFWAVPYTVLFFSYLFSMCALLGLLTRSSLAALLLTFLFWFVLFGVNATEQSLHYFKTGYALQVEKVESWVEAAEQKVQGPGQSEEAIERSKKELATKQTQLERYRAKAGGMGRWHGYFHGVKSVMPKSSETIELLQRTLVSEADLEPLAASGNDGQGGFFSRGEVPVSEREIQKRLAASIASRSFGWIVGTSLVFEAVVLGIGALVFRRRDF